MPVPKGKCILALQSLIEEKGYVDPAEVKDFLLEFDAKVKELMSKDTLLKQYQAEADTAKEMLDEIKAKAMIAKRNAAKQALATVRKFNEIKSNYKPEEYNTALKHFLGGSAGEFKAGSLNSVASRMDTASSCAISSFLDELQRANLDKYYMDPRNERSIMIELSELKEKGKSGRSGSDAAQQIAEIMHRHQEFWRQEANRNGAFIEELPGYSIAQTHDMYKLTPRKGETVDAAFKRWHDFILPLLDKKRTFRGMDEAKVLREIWDALQTGVHLDYEGDGIGINTGGNRAQRLSNSRKLHFKNGESFYSYNKEYGTGDLVWGYAQGLRRLSRSSVLMGEMGVNPRKMIDDLYKALKISTSRSSDTKVRGLMGSGDMDYHWDSGVRNLFLDITGKTNVPANKTLAQVGAFFRGYNSICRLGMATISSFSDIATQMSQAAFLGLKRHETLGNAIKMLTDISRKKLSPAEKQMLSSFGLLTENLVHNLHEHINAGTMGNGKMAKIQNIYFRLNGLDWWTSSLKKAMALTLTHDIGELLARGAEFGEYAKNMQTTMKGYGLGAKELALLKQMPLIKENGKHFIDANYVQQIPDESVAKYLGITKTDPGYKERIHAAKRDLEMKLQNFVYNRVTASVIEPDAVTRAWLNQGTQVGTPLGEAMRSVTQFKSFAVSIITKTINPWWFNTHGSEKVFGLGELLLTTTALGYLAVACKDVVRGKTPPELNRKTLTRAMLQGGALGLFGDVLFGEAQGNVSLAGTLGGPGLSAVDDVYHVYLKAINGDDAAADALRRVRNFVPGQNLFYANIPFTYLIMNNLQEMANPGYLNRLERNLYNKTGQEYWLDPGTFVK